MTTRTVYHVLRKDVRTCSLGEQHAVTVYAEKVIAQTDEVRINEVKGGYSDTRRENPVWVDAQGRLYDTYYAVDYPSGVRYVRRDDTTSWSGRKPYGLAERYDETESGPDTWPNVG